MDPEPAVVLVSSQRTRGNRASTPAPRLEVGQFSHGCARGQRSSDGSPPMLCAVQHRAHRLSGSRKVRALRDPILRVARTRPTSPVRCLPAGCARCSRSVAHHCDRWCLPRSALPRHWRSEWYAAIAWAKRTDRRCAAAGGYTASERVQFDCSLRRAGLPRRSRDWPSNRWRRWDCTALCSRKWENARWQVVRCCWLHWPG